MIATETDIKQFETALSGPAPAWDPDWKITKGILELMRAQAERILELEEMRNIDNFSQTATIRTLGGALKGGIEAKINRGNLTDAQVQEAVNDLNAATAAAKSGAKIAQYAGSILKFAMKIL